MSRDSDIYRELRRVFVSFSKAALAEHPQYMFTENLPDGKIFVMDSWVQNEEFPEKKPRIVVSRGRFADTKTHIGHLHNMDIVTGDAGYAYLKSGQMILNVVTSSDLLCDDLAGYLERMLLAAKTDFKRSKVIISSIVVGEPTRMDKESSFGKWFYVPVMVSISAQNGYSSSVIETADNPEITEFNININE